MQKIIERLIGQTDTSIIEPILRTMHDIFYDLNGIEKAIGELKDELGFWTRVNPFDHKEEKYQLKDLRREKSFYQSEYAAASKKLKDYLHACLDKDNALVMKSLAGRMDETMRKLYRKIRQYGMQKQGMGSTPQIGQMEEQIAFLNTVLSREYGFEAGAVTSDRIVDEAFVFLTKG